MPRGPPQILLLLLHPSRTCANTKGLPYSAYVGVVAKCVHALAMPVLVLAVERRETAKHNAGTSMVEDDTATLFE